MKKIESILLLGLLVLFVHCKETKKEDSTESDTDTEVQTETVEENIEVVNFKMEPKSNSSVAGEVSFTEENGQITMLATFSGLSPGEHAIHIHEKADCSSDDGKSTGGHWNPTLEPHGKWGAEEGFHKGDIGNFEADENGNGSITFTTDQWCLGCDDDTKNILGKAVIVHQGVDDFTSQPSGAAGARISCTGIIQ
ncbi:MAG: superoxide dismutase family protein [Bacteroidia bacterium]|nr:superoxide dismutase family protein [Bacteroidia bacterium]